MATSTQRAVSNGTLLLLDLSIDYLDRSEITVYFDTLETEEWSWVGTTEKRIAFSPAVPNGVEVLVKRTTDITQLRHEFSTGASFTAGTLDEDLKQVLHIAQEATEGNLGGDFYRDINMHNNRITNIGTAVDDTDALTLGQYKADALGANTAKDTAVAAAATSTMNAALTETDAASTAADAIITAADVVTTNANAASASASATAAQVAEAQSEAIYEDFTNMYLGPKEVAPSEDNQGEPLIAGALYFSTTLSVMRVYNGTVWITAYSPEAATVAGDVVLTPVGSFTSTNVQAGFSEASTQLAAKASTSALTAGLAPKLATATVTGAANKTTPVDSDKLVILDSAASFGFKALTWANLKATLKTYMDTLYRAVGVSVVNLQEPVPAAASIAHEYVLNDLSAKEWTFTFKISSNGTSNIIIQPRSIGTASANASVSGVYVRNAASSNVFVNDTSSHLTARDVPVASTIYEVVYVINYVGETSGRYVYTYVMTLYQSTGGSMSTATGSFDFALGSGKLGDFRITTAGGVNLLTITRPTFSSI